MSRPFACNSERKVPMTFKVWDSIPPMISEIAKKKGITKTRVVEQAVKFYFEHLDSVE
jgi:predicted transcriptional regulator